MERFFDVVTDRRGNAISGATVTVTNSAGSTATIYSDDGVTTTGNPLTTNADGEYSFYAANGTYSIRIVAEGYGSETKDGVVLYDPADLMGVAEVTTTSYTLSATDIGQWLDFNTSATATVTLSTASGYATGDSTIMTQKGGGQVVVSAGSGVTLRGTPTSKTRAQYAVLAVTKVAANTFNSYGDTASS